MIADSRQEAPVISRREEWRGRIVGIVTETVAFNGASMVREFVDHPGAVAIVALDDDGRLALINQYRHPVRARLWEIPAGLLDVDGENYLVAAERELAEETDLAASEWHVLADIFCTPGGSNESLRVYLARGLRTADSSYTRTEEEADMELRFVDLDEAADAVLDGRIHSPSATVGILAAARAKARGWKGLRPADAPWLR